MFRQIIRVISVLDDVLAKKQYLVGDKPTIADFSFVPWNLLIPFLLDGAEVGAEAVKAKYENFARWQEALSQHPAAKKILELKNNLVGA